MQWSCHSQGTKENVLSYLRTLLQIYGELYKLHYETIYSLYVWVQLNKKRKLIITSSYSRDDDASLTILKRFLFSLGAILWSESICSSSSERASCEPVTLWCSNCWLDTCWQYVTLLSLWLTCNITQYLMTSSTTQPIAMQEDRKLSPVQR